MATKYLMQGFHNGALISWLAPAPDWAGASAPAGSFPADIALSGGGIDDGSTVPSGAFVDHAGNPFVDHAGNPFV